MDGVEFSEVQNLRLFTVYGPWGRPDMSLFLFTDAIKNNHTGLIYDRILKAGFKIIGAKLV